LYKPEGYEGSASGEGWTSFGSTVTGGTQDVTGLQSNIRYEFAVRSTSETYGWSNIAYCRTFPVVPNPPTFSPPINFTGTNAIAAGRIDLTWTANNAANWTKTEIYYVNGVGVPTSSDTQLGTGFTGTPTDATNQTGLGNSFTRSYRARNNYNSGANYSEWTNVVTVTTQPPAPPATVPTNITLTGTGVYTVRVNWTANGGATTHRVQLDYDYGNFASPVYDINTSDTGGKPRNITGLLPDTGYITRVSGDNGANWSTTAFGSTYVISGGGDCILETNAFLILDAFNNEVEVVARDIQEGQRVIGTNAKTGERSIGAIQKVKFTTTDTLYHVTTKNGHQVDCSKSHRIITGFDDDRGTETMFLKTGNNVVIYDKISKSFKLDEVVQIVSETGLFNIVKISVASIDHTYIGNGILAHNNKL
jgi:hypothetical protein